MVLAIKLAHHDFGMHVTDWGPLHVFLRAGSIEPPPGNCVAVINCKDLAS